MSICLSPTTLEEKGQDIRTFYDWFGGHVSNRLQVCHRQAFYVLSEVKKN